MLSRFLAATLIALLVNTLGHYYIYMRLIEPLVEGGRGAWVMIFVTLWALSFFGFALIRIVPVYFRRFIEFIMFTWMGIAYLFLILCLLSAPLSLVVQFTGGNPALLAWSVLTCGVGLTLFSVFGALRQETVIPSVIPVKGNLPDDVEKLRVVVVSDVHVAGIIGKRRMRRLTAQVNALRPDLIFVTGDLVDGTVAQLKSQVAPLKELIAPQGVHYVTGNHEYYCNAGKWRKFLSEEFGWNVLSNANKLVEFGKLGINILGIEDRSWLALNKRNYRADPRLELATQSISEETAEERLNILLAHQPKDARQIAQYPWLDLQISGHTHGGQLWPLYLLVYSDQCYNKGLYSLAGNQQLYINQGTGFWGPPMRLGTKSEISLLTFRRRP
jgi:uncharacterized protein